MQKLETQAGARRTTTGAVTMLGVAAYGLGVHWAAQQTWQLVGVSALSISFLVLLPFALGAATVYLGPETRRVRLWYAICAPWATCLLVAALVVWMNQELLVCAFMALPIFLTIASLGGVGMRLYLRRKAGPRAAPGADAAGAPAPDSAGDTGNVGGTGNTDRTGMLAVGILLLLPHLGAPVEGVLAPPSSVTATVRTVTTAIEIRGEATQVWAHFVAVPTIQPAEAPFAWFPWLGLPRPVTAQLDTAEPPTLRTARYSNGMAVQEPITHWEPPYRYAFDVRVDEASLPNPLWRAVESEAFSVQGVSFTVMPHTVMPHTVMPHTVMPHTVMPHTVMPHEAGGERVTLQLTTTYRLQTPLNGYAQLWIDFLLRDFQRYILTVIKGRVEA